MFKLKKSKGRWSLLPIIVACTSFLFVMCTPWKGSVLTDQEIDRLKNHPAVPEKWKEEPVVLLSDSTRIELVVNESGNSVLYSERIVFLVTNVEPAIISNFPFFSSSTNERYRKMLITVIYPDGSTWSQSAAAEESARGKKSPDESEEVHRDDIELPKYITGMLVVQTLEISLKRPEFVSIENFVSRLPVLHRIVELSVPERAKIDYHLFDEEHFGIATTQSVHDGNAIVSFVADTLDKRRDADDFIEAQQVLPVLYYSFPPQGTNSYSWNEIGNYYLKLIRSAYSGKDACEKLASEVTGISPDSIVKSTVLLMRKNLRYFNYAEGVYSFVPHRIDSIIDRGYGDCKDLSVICQTIAGRKQNRCGLVLLRSADGFQPVRQIPTLNGFNHVVVFYVNENGERILVDPTSMAGDPLTTGYFFIGKQGLFLDRDSCWLDTIRAPAGFTNTIKTSSAVSIDAATRRWTLSGTITLGGMAALRLFTNDIPKGASPRIAFLKSYLKTYFAIDAASAVIEDWSDKSIVLHYSTPFQNNFIMMAPEGLILNKPSLYGGDVEYTTLEWEGPCYYGEIKQKDEWEVPMNFKNLEKEDLKTCVNEGAWAVDGNTVSREFRQRQLCVDAASADSMLEEKIRFSRALLWRKQ